MGLLSDALAGSQMPSPTSAIIVDDALSVLARLPTGAIDLVATDPPYGLSNGGTTCSSGQRVAVHKGDWDSALRADHSFYRQWIRQCQRVLKPSGTMWVTATHHALFSIGMAMQASGWRVLNLVTWQKPNPPPNLGCRQLTDSTEHVIWAAPHRREPLEHVFNYDAARSENGGKQLKDVWQIAAPGADEKTHGKHPTQKPVELFRRIVELSTAPGAVVLDPFCGSGTTGVAALLSGRRFVGVELDSGYARIASDRMSEAFEQARSIPLYTCPDL